jgi:ubiquinone/menaquinone biosynthesis C-methylase UbiE
MKFTKYEKLGAYHWELYESNALYRQHADRVKTWVEEKSVLDIGAGDGRITALLGIQGIDDEPEAVRLAKEKGANVELGDAYTLNFDTDSFDAVLMCDVLEHFRNPTQPLMEAHRVLRDKLYIVTPIEREPGKVSDVFHYQEWAPMALISLVEEIHNTPSFKRYENTYRYALWREYQVTHRVLPIQPSWW